MEIKKNITSTCKSKFLQLFLLVALFANQVFAQNCTTAPVFDNYIVGEYGYTKVNSAYGIACGSSTANLSVLVASPAAPAGTTVTWHSATPATDGNKLTPAQVSALTGATRKVYAAFWDSVNGCYSPTKMITVYAALCAKDDDFTATPIIFGQGGTLPSIYANDTYKGIVVSTLTPNSVQWLPELWTPANAQVDLTNAATYGALTIPATLAPGLYEYMYSINDNSPDAVPATSKSTAIVRFRVVADSDKDGIPDYLDLDDDNDGILDTDECNAVEKVTNGFNGPGVSFTGWTLDGNPNGWVASSGIAIESSYDNPGIHKIKQTVNGLVAGKTYTLKFETFAAGTENPNVNALSVTIDGVTYYSKAAGVGIGTVGQSESISFSTKPNGTSAVIEFTSTVTGTMGSTGKDVFVRKVSILACDLDTDGDGIPDYLDLDSDNDGCVDAQEGDENVANEHLVTASGTVAVGFGSSASKQNLGNTVDANGVPTIVNAGGAADIGGDVGQGIGISLDNLTSACCTNPPATGTPDGYTKTGISNLVGFTGGATGWPGNVPNGFVAIESKNKGFVITRVASSSSILTPVEGMLIYDIAAACVKLYNGTTWKCLAKDCTPLTN